MKYQIVPYVKTENGYSIADEIMGIMFLKAQEQGLIEKTFIDGKTNSVADWMILLRNPNNLFHVVWDIEKKIPVAVFWLNEWGANHASAHFFIYREAWGNGSKDIGRETLKYWFNMPDVNQEKSLLDVIIGRIPADNRVAIRYTKSMGFKEIGTIPHVAHNAYTGKTGGMTILYKENKEDG